MYEYIPLLLARRGCHKWELTYYIQVNNNKTKLIIATYSMLRVIVCYTFIIFYNIYIIC